MKELATITLLEDDHLLFKHAETGEETTINMRYIGALWNLKMKLVELFLPELRWDQIDVLNPPELVKERGKTMLNEKFPSVWLELGVPFKVVRRPRGLKANQRMELLRFHHSGGRWGQDLADGELNSTGDLAIISYEKDDEDHMFSSSLDIKWWIYEMATMRELKVDGMPELKYSMLINSLGQREQGIDNVTFHPEKPNTVLVHFDKEPDGTVPPPFEMNFEPEACP